MQEQYERLVEIVSLLFQMRGVLDAVVDDLAGRKEGEDVLNHLCPLCRKEVERYAEFMKLKCLRHGDDVIEGKGVN